MNRIAPNNTLPATHFIEVWKGAAESEHIGDLSPIEDLQYHLEANDVAFLTIAIFRIRENKLPTIHNFNK